MSRTLRITAERPGDRLGRCEPFVTPPADLPVFAALRRDKRLTAAMSLRTVAGGILVSLDDAAIPVAFSQE